MKYVVELNGKKYEVEVDETEAVLLGVSEDGTAGSVSVKTVNNAPDKTAQERGAVKAAPDGGVVIKAPMPGTILAVGLDVGAAVKKGDVMFVLEAMKMENDIVAPENGVVKQVLVSKGDSVNTDDILGVI